MIISFKIIEMTYYCYYYYYYITFYRGEEKWESHGKRDNFFSNNGKKGGANGPKLSRLL